MSRIDGLLRKKFERIQRDLSWRQKRSQSDLEDFNLFENYQSPSFHKIKKLELKRSNMSKYEQSSLKCIVNFSQDELSSMNKSKFFPTEIIDDIPQMKIRTSDNHFKLKLPKLKKRAIKVKRSQRVKSVNLYIQI